MKCGVVVNRRLLARIAVFQLPSWQDGNTGNSLGMGMAPQAIISDSLCLPVASFPPCFISAHNLGYFYTCLTAVSFTFFVFFLVCHKPHSQAETAWECAAGRYDAVGRCTLYQGRRPYPHMKPQYTCTSSHSLIPGHNFIPSICP